MAPPRPGNRPVRFGLFEADLRAGQLRKGGVKVRLRGQPFDVLAILLERPGDLVTREELQQRLWSKDTFVDFEHGLNKAVNKVRDALGDNAENPRFIETLPRKGYRFIFPMDLAPPAEIRLVEPAAPPASRRLLYIEIAGISLAVIAALLALTIHFFSGSSTQSLNIVPLTSYPGAELYPSFSPDGNEIAFAWNSGDASAGFDLYRKQIGSENAIRLTHTPGHSLAPAWSPDGRFIAFSRSTPDDAAVYIIPALGGQERKLADISGVSGMLPTISWSPDSKTLAVPGLAAPGTPTEFTTAQIHLIDVQTLAQRTLPSPPGCPTAVFPAFSPAGDWLAVGCPSNELSSVYVESLDGKTFRKLASFQRDLWGLTWTSDGKSVIYSAQNFLWKVPARGGTAEKLVYGQNLLAPAVSRAGNRLAYSQQNGWRNNLTLWRLDFAAPDRPQGPAVKVLSSAEGQEAPRVSPDGKRVVFESARSGNLEIWAANSDGSNLLQLTSFGGPVTGTPRWAPDSRRIVFDSRAGGYIGIYVMDAAGGPSQRLNTGTPDASQPSWSGDGRWIYFVCRAQPGILKVPVAGGAPIQLTKDVAAGLPLESADGKRVFYEVAFSRIKSMSVNGGDERDVSRVISDTWTPTRNGIYLLDDRTSPMSLNLIHPETGRVQKVAEIPGRLGGWGVSPSVSADGRTLIVAVNDEMTGDIMLVEGFR